MIEIRNFTPVLRSFTNKHPIGKMAHHLNTNKQFMLGNGLLAFGVIIVIVLFVYVSMRHQRGKDDSERYFTESYSIKLMKGFADQEFAIYINDSLIINQMITEEPFTIEVPRFAEQSALMIVENATDNLYTFDLSERGGSLSFSKDEDGVKQLPTTKR